MNISCNLLSKDIQEIKRITWVGVGVNVFLSGVKLFLGILGGSQAVVADAVHSISDLSTDFAVLFGVRFWSKPADKSHPYGHGRIETIITIVMGLVLLLIGVGIAYHALITFSDNAGRPSWIAFWGAFFSIVFKEALYRWTVAVGRKVKSSAVVANAWHHRTDALSSIPVAITVAVASVSSRWAFLDNIGAFVASLFILYASWKIIHPALYELVDAGTSKRNREKIESIVLDTDGVKSFHALRSRRMGASWYIDLHIQVDPHLSVLEGHNISEQVKVRLIKEGPEIADVVVHLEPYVKHSSNS